MKCILLMAVLAGVTSLACCASVAEAMPDPEKAVPEQTRKKLEIVEKSETDLRDCQTRWAREEWIVLSISARLPQADGTVHLKVELARSPGRTAKGVGYDDQRIAMVRRGKTTEGQLLEWFGPPESRAVGSDGRGHLAWTFAGPGAGAPEKPGRLSVSLDLDSRVEAYSSQRSSSQAHRSEEFVEKPDSDIGKLTVQWAREGWNVLSMSGPLPQADGTVHHRVELSRAEELDATWPGYNDGQIAKIKRGETTEDKLLEWFGSPGSRKLAADGRLQLTWSLAGRTNAGPARSGDLIANLGPNGKVDSYSARQSSQ